MRGFNYVQFSEENFILMENECRDTLGCSDDNAKGYLPFLFPSKRGSYQTLPVIGQTYSYVAGL